MKEKILKGIGITNRIISLCIAGVCISVAFLLGSTFLTSHSLLHMGIQSFVVVTGSMEPSIPVGSIIYTQKKQLYEIGDVITYQIENTQPVTHRIVEILEKNGNVLYHTKGDANSTNDAFLVDSQRVLGKQIVALPYLGKFFTFLKTPIGFFAFVLIPGFLFIGFELASLIRELAKQKENSLGNFNGIS